MNIEMKKDLEIVFEAFKQIRKVLRKWDIGIEDALLIFRLSSYNGKWLSFRYAPIIMKRMLAIRDKFDFSTVQKKNLFDGIEMSNPQRKRPAKFEGYKAPEKVEDKVRVSAFKKLSTMFSA